MASASIAALLTAPVQAGPGQTITTNQAAVALPAGGTTNFLIVTGASVAGAVTNAGTIKPGTNLAGIGRTGTTAALTLNHASVGGGITNSGTISASAGGGALPIGILVNNSTVSSGIVNSGTINITGGTAIGLSGGGGDTTIIGGITNSGTINVSNGRAAIGGFLLPPGPPTFSRVTGSIVNSGTITVSGADFFAIFATFGGAAGGVTNTGKITGNGSGILAGSELAVGMQVETGPEPATASVVNSGTITASHTGVVGLPGGTAVGIELGRVLGLNSADIAGGVTNSGTITASAPRGKATGLYLGPAPIVGGITNSGTIIATGAESGIGIRVGEFANALSTIVGGITNTGTIVGSTAAIDVSEQGFGAPFSLHGDTPTTINQMGGALIGSVLGFGNNAGDVLNFSGGQIILSPTQSITGFSTFTQTGGTLVLGVTQNTAPGSFASVNVGAATLGGTLQLAPSGNLTALAAAPTTFKDIVVSGTPITGSFAAVTTPISLFQASVSPDGPNALDATLSLSRPGLSASAQNLTQSLRFGLESLGLLSQTIEDRLVGGGTLAAQGGGGAMAALAFAGGQPPQFASGVLSDGGPGPGTRDAVWARAYGVVGSAPASGAAVAYQEGRAGFLAGADAWVAKTLVVGVAAGYTNTNANFADGSLTTLNSYQGAAYAGWRQGPWYATASAGASVNNFTSTRQLAPFGLSGAALSNPSGTSFSGTGEVGYGLELARLTVTPVAGLAYVHTHIDGFSEIGGFGALTTAAADADSLQTILGARFSTRLAVGNRFGPLVPELRLGWAHELLDAAQSLNAALVNCRAARSARPERISGATARSSGQG